MKNCVADFYNLQGKYLELAVISSQLAEPTEPPNTMGMQDILTSLQLLSQCRITQHNHKLLLQLKDTTRPSETSNQPYYNIRKKDLGPLSGKCLESAIIYEATVSSTVEEKSYLGATEQTFKKHYPKDKEAVNKKNSNASTSLSTHVWSHKDKGEDPKVK